VKKPTTSTYVYILVNYNIDKDLGIAKNIPASNVTRLSDQVGDELYTVLELGTTDLRAYTKSMAIRSAAAKLPEAERVGQLQGLLRQAIMALDQLHSSEWRPSKQQLVKD